ncbi:MAG: hypothetical protein IPK79_04555 [Vampirovibrionales bacterium]|nr:hypothetical protein [Vampirovibrionales bacterium]
MRSHTFFLSFPLLMQWVTRLLGVVALAALIASALVVIPAFFFAHLPLTLLMTPIMLTLLPTLLLGLGLLPFLALLCWLACRVFRLRLDEAGVTLSLGPYQRAMLWLETRQTQAARLFGLPCVLMEGLARDARLRVPTGLIRDGESLGKALLAFTPAHRAASAALWRDAPTTPPQEASQDVQEDFEPEFPEADEEESP